MTRDDRPPDGPGSLPSGPVLAVCGWSGSGKTTLLERLVPRLRERCLAVAIVKNDAHRFEVDRPGKDSDRLYRAGANIVLGANDETFTRRHADGQRPLPVVLADLLLDHDLVLVEGHKSTALPKVWLEGGDRERPEGLDGLLGVLAWDSDRERAMLDLLDRWLDEAWRRPPVFGGILVGGRSRRMARDKAALELDGRTFLGRIRDALEPHVERVVLLGQPVAPAAGGGDLLSVPDPPQIDGPLAGLTSAVRWAPGATWIVVGCDMPLVRPEAVHWLLSERRPGVWAILPTLVEDRVEPLLACYEAQTAGLLADLAATGPLAPRRLAEHRKVATPTPPPPLVDCWRNVNTPQDLDALR